MNTVWVDIFKLGAAIHLQGRAPLRFTEQFARTLVANFTRFRARGETFPVLAEHARSGWQYGAVHGLRIAGGYVQAALEFFRAEDRDAYNRGMLREFSPGFSLDYLDPHTGESVGPSLVEVSFTAIAAQRNLRPPQQTNPGVRLATNDYITAESPRTATMTNNGTVQLSAALRDKIARDALEESRDAEIGFELAAGLGDDAGVIDVYNAALAEHGEARANKIVSAWATLKREGQLWTVSQAATFLQLSADRVGKLATAGEIPSVKFGGTRRYSPQALRQWAAFGGAS